MERQGRRTRELFGKRSFQTDLLGRKNENIPSIMDLLNERRELFGY